MERNTTGGTLSTLDAHHPASSCPEAGSADELAFGTWLVGLGLVSEAQLRDALEQQQTLAELGERRSLAEVLVALGYLSPEQLAAVLPPDVQRPGGPPAHAAQAVPAKEHGLADRLAEWLRKAIKLPA